VAQPRGLGDLPFRQVQESVTSPPQTALLVERGEAVERFLVVILREVRRVELLLGDRRPVAGPGRGDDERELCRWR
jgi:hypothetical protein